MNDFTASNGVTVKIVDDEQVIFTVPNRTTVPVWLHAGEIAALREFFRAEEDERLGRFRQGEFVVYPDGEDTLGYRHVVTVWEKNGRRDSIYENNIPNTVYGAAARAYFDAHSEPKPWHEAKPGEVWALMTSRDHAEFAARACIVNETASFENVGHITDRFDADDPRITAGRRIWPEVTS